jgi:TFIIF-interacting CTD phosphatase-like protein
VIAFDLDETLVFASRVKPSSSDYFTIRIGRRPVFVRMRPGLAAFVSRVPGLYDVFFFTASESHYTSQIIDVIAPSVPDPQRFSRDAWVCHSGFFVKDLRRLKRPLCCRSSKTSRARPRCFSAPGT